MQSPSPAHATATQVWQLVIGDAARAGGHLLPYLAGIVAYPLGWMLLAEPVRRRFAPQVPWLPAAIVYGVALWVFALYIMAHLVAGSPAFLDFTGITWVALVGNILYAVAAAAVAKSRGS